MLVERAVDHAGCVGCRGLHGNIYFTILMSMVILQGMLHRLFIYDVGNIQMFQLGAKIIYCSRQPDENFSQKC